MSLKPTLFTLEQPNAKFSLNINAFNGNNTNFGRCQTPSSKSVLNTIPKEPTSSYNRQLPTPSRYTVVPM